MNPNPVEQREQDKNTLYVFSILFLIFAVISLINIIIPAVQGQLSPEYIVQMSSTPEYTVTIEMAKPIIIGTIALAVLSVLALVYMGVMGLRQAKDKKTGSFHIIIATICVVFLVIGLIAEVISLFTAPAKDWVGFFTTLASVAIGVLYIRAAKALRTE